VLTSCQRQRADKLITVSQKHGARCCMLGFRN
jgi:hypothetical protein